MLQIMEALNGKCHFFYLKRMDDVLCVVLISTDGIALACRAKAGGNTKFLPFRKLHSDWNVTWSLRWCLLSLVAMSPTVPA